jgi:hypothetical protein
VSVPGALSSSVTRSGTETSVPHFTAWFGIAASNGASSTALTVMVNVWTGLALTPPFAVPPLSASCTETVAVPAAFAAGA